MSELKIKAAKAAIAYIEDDMVIGVGTGSTVNFFIKELAAIKHKIEACVASSKATEALLRAEGIPVIDLNSVQDLPIYVDGADEVNERGEMIKGGGGALTREKIVANVATQFICIVDESKVVKRLGEFPVAVEVIPMARSFVARQIVKLGGDPEYREGFITDNGNIILDVFNLNFSTPMALEDSLNVIPGVVENGVFAKRLADKVLVASASGVNNLK
ncbi:TPA: ribose-5-phosphate isomerase RpiA [Legionella pneumophila]|uniref:Ribose-5-phosphate isomerase A n=2 Tax=Legionella pneumophila TaxID=446 RepID=RPIA_LEGPL|nr:ribose-5-phosphate isomerase RpiA [Legionella pneumophila]Q5X0C7.1 RecName: Full=Ribose-5-phosphate isomerase A; AltName: Full=Phosphoriboisomerase A; Short=PRI [Legionella pneumophila str. Lens]AMQ26554.1 ribose 5-phosphate isomerase [Legionella pneumophila subsp. pneumophila]AOW53168.1 ribose 5-phosphate isomerase A [Legionella pneumophila subsp. pneumophila]AOW55932.1 ribose 5-phosphate isomerase A [Legionella pneumophila subsp. pneumophila]AOW58510.1 ribose 5-phosphate isomerase A [Legi